MSWGFVLFILHLKKHPCRVFFFAYFYNRVPRINILGGYIVKEYLREKEVILC
ncbi:gp27 [Brochothrix phage BL3]|uniref:gp27 n=1 Tax=Brochothrix phage BL3 TaxID=764562 RepID=UPI0001D9ADC4|nr:gp27 [Brochothrix phage BL3]ADH03108.1 gp27 [Brochothrix phage BL3]